MLERIIFAIVEMFCMFAVGAYAVRLKIIEEIDLNKLSRLVIDVMFPLMAFHSITRHFDTSNINELWLLPALGFGMMFFGGLLGYGLRYGMLNRGEGRMETFHHYCAINNYVFLPLLVLGNVYGHKYMSLLFIMNIGSTVGIWTVGVGLLGGGSIKGVLKNIFTVNLFAVIIALIVAFSGLPIPGFLDNVFRKIGGAAVPFMLIIIGAAIYSNGRFLFTSLWDIVYLTAVRLIIIPLIIIGILRLLPIPEEVYRVAVVVAIMPVSASSAIITRRFGGNPDFAGQAIIVTTTVSMVTIPLMFSLFVLG
ncbi:AEC family transporter [Lentisphaerota bacterium ZTH]|nr:AEC family transporter [Lentisphaerota bacterium]WET05455.1 AEC family transporter [Lentisphaerota bacterium ZTH]